MSRVLVLGAGELGLPILRSLSNSPTPSRPAITLLIRPSTLSSPSPSKSQELAHLRDLGVSFLAADIAASNATELASHFRNFDIIISCTGFAGGPGTQLKLARAVCAAGVAHYYPWQFGVDYDIIGPEAANGIFREQCEVRRLLRGQDKTKWTIVSTGMFTSFLFEAFFGVVEGLESAGADGEAVVVRALGSWGNEVTVTTPEDIGRVVSRLVLEDRRAGVVFTAGDTVSYGRLADLVERQIGKKVRREVWSLDFLRAELETDPENQIKKYRCLFAEGKGVSWDRASTVNEELNIKTTDVQGFLSPEASPPREQ